MLGHFARVIDIIQRAAPAGLGCIRDAMLAGQPRLVPKLKCEAHHRVLRSTGPVALVGEHRRNRRGVDPSGHGYGDGCVLSHRFSNRAKLAGSAVFGLLH